MSTQYSVSFHNQSGKNGKFCVFQVPAEAQQSNVMSLAWLVKQSNDDTDLDIDWTIDYSFVWSETGVLKPGVKFRASQTKPADPSKAALNAIHFSKPNEGYTFEPPMEGEVGEMGNLTIFTGPEIPKKKASVGIGMSGSGTFAVNAEPNYVVTFSPHPIYWVGFGNYEKGVVIDTQSMTKFKQITFEPNNYHLEITLDQTNSWTVTDLLQYNASK